MTATQLLALVAAHSDHLQQIERTLDALTQRLDRLERQTATTHALATTATGWIDELESALADGRDA